MLPFNRFLNLMRKPSVVIVYLACMILSFLYWDRPIAAYFYHLDVRAAFPAVSFITTLGSSAIYLPSLVILGLFFRYIKINYKAEAAAWFLFLTVAIPDLLCGVFKMLFGRARPSLWLHHDIYGFYGFNLKSSFWSFPSGHTTTIISLMLGLGIVFPRFFWGFLSIGIGIALSRILLMHHYLSDVLAASYLSLFEVGIIFYGLRYKGWLVPALRHEYNKNLIFLDFSKCS